MDLSYLLKLLGKNPWETFVCIPLTNISPVISGWAGCYMHEWVSEKIEKEKQAPKYWGSMDSLFTSILDKSALSIKQENL